MSKYLKIYVDGQVLELPENGANLVLTYSLRDREGIATNTGTRSEYSLQVPASKRNDQIFGSFWNVGVISSTAQAFRRSRIEINGLQFFTGKALLKSAKTNGALYGWKGSSYEVQLYGNNADWVTSLRDRRLNEYQYGTHIFNDSNIFNGWNRSYAAGNIYCYCLIKWKNWEVPGKIKLQESTPALFVRSIVDFIFKDLGYSIESTFLDSLFFKRLILPVPKLDKYPEQFGIDYLNVKANQPTTALLSGFPNTVPFTNQTLAPAVGPNPFSSGVYTVPEDGFYLVSYIFTFSNVTGSGVLFDSELKKNGVQVPKSRLIGIVVTSPSTYKVDVVVECLKNDLLRVDYGSILTSGTADYTCNLDITGEVAIKDGTLIDFKYLIPREWKSLDFIKGLAHAFNLVFETNVIRQSIRIEPSDKYLYSQRSPVISSLENGFYLDNVDDIRNRLDLAKEGEVINNTLSTKSVVLKWKTDSNDPTAEAIEQGELLGLASAKYKLPSTQEQDEEVIENPFFANTLMILDEEPRDVTSQKTPLFPLIWAADYTTDKSPIEANYNVLPRLLQFEGFAGGANAGLIQVDGIGLSSYPYAYTVDYNDTFGHTMSLSFGKEIINGFTKIGLLERFYMQEMARNRVGKDVECFLFWNALTINNLTFRNKIVFRGDRFILQEINSFNVLSDASTKTFLRYDVSPEQIDIDNIENTQLTNKLST